MIPILCFLLFLLYSTVREYKPEVYTLIAESEVADELKDSVFTAMIWNIGFAGLGENMDFFYDGGEMVRDSYEGVSMNFNNIKDFLLKNSAIDFILLQEVDEKSKRSYRINQFEAIDSLLKDHSAYLGLNYKVDFVPVPPKAPLGNVNSGIALLSKYKSKHVSRQGFIGNYSWPTKLFMLKRCFLVARFPVQGDKELLLINVHNSAYDDGSLRAAQLDILEEFALHEYQKGNYVLFGGDWNQSPSGFSPRFSEPFDTINVSYLPAEFLNGWEVVNSRDVPSNRRLLTPYKKELSQVSLIDFFICSPNIQVKDMQAFDLQFKNSDHNPVALTFKINN